MTTKPIALAACLAFLNAAALAQERPSTTSLTCRQAAGLVASRGAVVLGTGGATYDRFVRDRGFCEITEAVQRAFVPTRDTPQCLIGYRCFEPSQDDFFRKF